MAEKIKLAEDEKIITITNYGYANEDGAQTVVVGLTNKGRTIRYQKGGYEDVFSMIWVDVSPEHE